MGIPAMAITTVMDMIPLSTISSGDKYDIMFFIAGTSFLLLQVTE